MQLFLVPNCLGRYAEQHPQRRRISYEHRYTDRHWLERLQLVDLHCQGQVHGRLECNRRWQWCEEVQIVWQGFPTSDELGSQDFRPRNHCGSRTNDSLSGLITDPFVATASRRKQIIGPFHKTSLYTQLPICSLFKSAFISARHIRAKPCLVFYLLNCCRICSHLFFKIV